LRLGRAAAFLWRRESSAAAPAQGSEGLWPGGSQPGISRVLAVANAWGLRAAASAQRRFDGVRDQLREEISIKPQKAKNNVL